MKCWGNALGVELFSTTVCDGCKEGVCIVGVE